LRAQLPGRARSAHELHQLGVQNTDERLSGVRLASTSAPSALALTDSMNDLTTGSATSASSSATRASRSVSATFSSVIRPRPRRFSMVRERRA